MKTGLRIAVPVILLAALAIYLAFPRPIRDPAQLQAIAAESRQLMASQMIGASADMASISKAELPPAIARLKPERVIVRRGRVEIVARDYFDGGWGYGYAPDKQDLGMLPEC